MAESTERDVPARALGDWLDELAADRRPRVLLGGTGHLALSADEETRTARALEQSVLPALAAAAPGAEIVALTGLAPGADLLFAETTAAWFAREPRPFRRVGLLPVPPEVLWGDWLTRAGTHGAGYLQEMRRRFDRNLAACDVVLRLWHDGAQPDWPDLVVRQREYRRLGACLAEQCDVLVAILRAGHTGAPGGAAEVLAWREHGANVPAELSSGARRHASGWSSGDRVFRIDPSGPAAAPSDVDPWTRHAREALKGGNYLLCYDVVSRAEQQGHVSQELRYLKLLALANAGSTEAALRQFGELRSGFDLTGEDWLALEGRLHKDLALRGGATAAQEFRRASQCYRAAFEKTGGYFSAINAATTALLGGDAAQAQALARDLLAHVQRLAPSGERDHYYLRVTAAEAALLLADTAAARAALTEANRLLTDDINARSRTRQQLQRICDALSLDDTVLTALSLPPVIYQPPLPEGSAPPPPPPAAVSFAFAGITHPRELEAAERLLERNVRLHAVLAAPRERMLARWQAAHGAGWTLRLGRAFERLHETSTALGFLDGEERWCDGYAGAMALGLSRLTARRLGCGWQALGGVAPPLVLPGPPASADFSRRFAGVIFADFAGFSRLTDEDLPPFWAHFMRSISERLATQRAGILLKHTWGDALHIVTDTAQAAAAIGCEIQACLEAVRPHLTGALQHLELRLSAHWAPVFAGRDPVEDMATYFGTQLSFTARIEPVTPPGMIFVTEAFAAQIALEGPDAFTLEYAGEIRLAKAYGQSRLFSLRRVGAK